MKKAILRLFNAVQFTKDTIILYDPPISGEILSQTLLERTIRNGYILDPAIKPSEELLTTIESIVGISGEKANAAFHKSWAVVRDSSMEQLVIQQIVHYITTYGFEALGIYHKDTVYIPHEDLKLPAIQEDIPLTIIKGMDAQEILDSIIDLGSGIALSQETLDDILTIVIANDYDSNFVQKIGNRELRTLLSDLYNIVPSEPVEFLRYLVSKLTNESLLIKNDYLINKIKVSDEKVLDALIKDVPENLASIFFRFKPLFLAMKSISHNKTFFNQLRKKAKKLHIPMSEDYLNTVTSRIKHQKSHFSIQEKIDRANIFRKIRLAYALKYRLYPGDSIVYRIRNGRGWATEFDWPNNLEKPTRQVLDIVLTSITNDIRKNVEGKTILIPSYVHYALPATEKQFTGNLPTGSSVSVPQDMIVGIHWTNNRNRVDLDLSVIGESGKTGWDSSYRTEGRDVLFSGDITDAPKPNGATELFYLREGQQEARILMVNHYNFGTDNEVAAKILVAHEKPEIFDRNYMMDISNIIVSANINITKKQNVLGLIVNHNGENRVYFANVSIGNSITSSQNEQSTHARKYLVRSLVNSLDFREILSRAGATIVDEKPDSEYLDLSPEALDKTTIINLIRPKS